jgi:hypothetical protein
MSGYEYGTAVVTIQVGDQAANGTGVCSPGLAHKPGLPPGRTPAPGNHRVSGGGTVAVNSISADLQASAQSQSGIVSGTLSDNRVAEGSVPAFSVRATVASLGVFGGGTQAGVAGPVSSPPGMTNWWFVDIQEGRVGPDSVRDGQTSAAEAQSMCQSGPAPMGFRRP